MLLLYKISVLNKQIKQVSEERDRVAFSQEEGVQIDEARITELTDKLRELRHELELQELHMTRELLPGLKSQFNRIKETVNTMLYYDKTLGEKIQTLFREQGITIVSIITAIGFAVSTIAISITLGIKAATPNPKSKPGSKPEPKPDPKPDPRPDPKPDPKPTSEPEPTPGSKSG